MTTVDIAPGTAWQPIVDACPPGTTFTIRAGIHRHQSVAPKDSQSFLGEPGAVLTGARVLSSAAFRSAGPGVWTIGQQTQASPLHGGACQMTPRFAEDWSGCDYNEELFIDRIRQRHVTTRGAVGPGAWFFDYPHDTIVIGTDPADRLVETSITPYAFLPTADHVSIAGLTIEQYACPAQYGAINAEGTAGWSVRDCLLQLHHGGGVRLGHYCVVRGNAIMRNGQIGVVGAGHRALILDNEIAYSNEAHFDPGWEAGGMKIVLSDGAVVAGNRVHHNGGPGIWGDIDNRFLLIEKNVVEDNEQIGIFYEISYGAVIRQNIVRRNGLAPWVSDYIWGVGILVAASPDVEVAHNVLEGNRGGVAGVQQPRGTGTYGPHLVTGLHVHHNTTQMDQIACKTPVWQGLCDDTGSSTIFVSDGNRFSENGYRLKGGGSGNYFVWGNSERAFDSWQGCGQDTHGRAAWF
jgi:Right handed beta helix region